MRGATTAVLVLASSAGLAADVPDVVQSRGADARVDYQRLAELGRWDDRNYELTEEDLAVLSTTEAELDVDVPVFFRVWLRQHALLPTSGPVQYPHSLEPQYRVMQWERELLDRGWGSGGVAAGGTEDTSPAVVDSRGSETRITFPSGAAEAAVAINPADPRIVVAGSVGPGPGQQMHRSVDGGRTWRRSALPGGSACCDPTVAWSSDGRRAYTATLASGFRGIWFYRSGDGGLTWDDLRREPGGEARREIGGLVADKEFLHVDIAPRSPWRDKIYLTWQEANVVHLAWSWDYGHAWSEPVVFDAAPSGIGSDVTTDREGRVFLVWPSFSEASVVITRSDDGGQTFRAPRTVAFTNAVYNYRIPSQESRQVAVIVSADSDLSDGPDGGTVYAAWNDILARERSDPSRNHSLIQVAASRDGGETWTVSTPHEVDDLLQVDRWQPWLRVGPEGTVHLIFYDTRRDPSRRSVDLFYAQSRDGARSWSTPERLTASLSPNASGTFELGDYNGLDVVGDQLVAVFTDNRHESAETLESGDSKDIYAVTRRLSPLRSADPD